MKKKIKNVRVKKTKIICTLGPATNSVKKIVELIELGMNIARLNFSHGSYDEHEGTIKNIKKASEIVGWDIPFFVDLCGPKIRCGEIDGVINFKNGDKTIVTTEDIVGTKERFSTIYTDLHKDLKADDIVLINDGTVELKVEKVVKKDIYCVVTAGGVVSSRKGINLPYVEVSTKALTDKDKQDALFGIRHGAAYLALSFVRRAQDVIELKDFLKKYNFGTPVISKIEKPSAVDEIDDIIAASDAIMIARGDLGVEMPTESVPQTQKMIIKKCIYNNCPVITATQMLESMISAAIPTRAEASDVANAVLDGTDAVMLSAETSVGKYPKQAVKIMRNIIMTYEDEGILKNWMHKKIEDAATKDVDSIVNATSHLAHSMDAAAIISITKSGRTAKMLSKFRSSVPVLAYSEDEVSLRTMSLFWGVLTNKIEKVGDTDRTMDNAVALAKKSKFVDSGDNVIFVAGVPMLESRTVNMIRVYRVF